MAYLGRRIGFYLVTAWAAITMNFFIPRLMPGNPAQILLSRGIGYILLEAVGNEDYPLMQAIFLIITLAVLVANLLADLVYVVLDPRSRQEA
jgi:ABC-type dipeptide/oligopeptide/nickel transport system permease component